MKTKEFFQNLPSLQNDNIDPEFHVYTTVWMKSRMPEAYNELISSYKTVESEIYAQNEANSANCKDLF
jgi:hypothetical protein|tara:strand:+ start:303 stop:506 length:204 start_codon:yes stop_codon:yes gene_type:complete